MAWSRAHSVQMGLVAVVVLSCLAAVHPAFGAPRKRVARERERVASRQQDTTKQRSGRPEATVRQPREAARAVVSTSKQKGQYGRLLRAAPATGSGEAKSRQRDASPAVWSAARQQSARVNTQYAPRASEPRLAPRATLRQREPAQRPGAGQLPAPAARDGKSPSQLLRTQPADAAPRSHPYGLYRPSQKPAPAESGSRVLRSQPTAPAARVDRPGAQVWQTPARENRVRVRPTDPQINREPLRERNVGPGRTAPSSPSGGEQRFSAPRANFRGPEAERNLRVVPAESRQRVQRDFQELLRDNNRRALRPGKARPSRDVVGNTVPADARLLVRDKIGRISNSYRRVERDFGPPSHRYLISPRSRLSYWDGYWDGYADGHWAGRHYGHHTQIVVSYYYPYYWSDPSWLAFHYPGHYPSIYHYWGWCPAWVYPARVYYAPVQYVYVPVTAYRYYHTGYAVDQVAAQGAVEDIRRAWFNSEIAPIAYHLTDRLDVRIYFDGEYSYTTSTEDYYAMTVDAMATTQTVALDFDNPIWISSHEAFFTGRHVFYDPTDERQTVYVSYRLRRLGTEWYIVAVGTSLEPIRHQYRDFRYS